MKRSSISANIIFWTQLCITPQKISHKGHHFQYGNTARSLPPKQAQLLRDNVKDCIKDLKQNNKSNLSNKQQKALSKLKENDSIVVLPADKGNSTVIMDK